MSDTTVMVAGCSETHTRDSNQDRMFPPANTLAKLNLPHCFAIADGMGGTQDGAIAATTAIEGLDLLPSPSQYLQQYPTHSNATLDGLHTPSLGSLSTSHTHALLQHHFSYANQRIIQHIGRPGQSGSTLSALLLLPHAIYIGHIGDSRIYLWRDGELLQLTQDHNVYTQRCHEGALPFFPKQLSLQHQDRQFIQEHHLSDTEFYYQPGLQEAVSPKRQEYISQELSGRFAEQLQLGKITPVHHDKNRLALALGKQSEIPHILLNPPVSTPQMGDLFLLCTDGLSGVLSHTEIAQRTQQIAQRIARDTTLTMLHWGCQQLLDDAIQAGSNDNISILLVYVDQPLSEAHAAPAPPTHSPVQEGDTSAPMAIHPINSPRIAKDTIETVDPEELILQEHPTLKEEVHPPWRLLQMTQPEADGHTAIPAPSPRSSTPSVLTPRHYQMIIGALLLVLFYMVIQWPRQKQTIDRPSGRIAHTKSPTSTEMTGPKGLFWVQLPGLTDAPAHQLRLQWLQRLHHNAFWLEYLWHLPKTQTQALWKAIGSHALSHHQFLRSLRKLPREPQDLQAFDQGLRQALRALWHQVAPTYLRYLDDMAEAVALPQHTAHPLSLRRKERLQLVRHWQRMATPLFHDDWHMPLLLERLGHPKLSLHTPHSKHLAHTKRQLQQCITQLQLAHQRLSRQHPSHPLLSPLHNRIQLHHAHLRQLQKQP